MSPTRTSFKTFGKPWGCSVYDPKMNNYQTFILLHLKFRLARLLNSFQYGCQFSVMELPKEQQTSKQADNQEFFRAGKFSWNQGTSINNHLQQEKERPHRKKFSFFCLRTPKICTLNEKFNPQMTTIRVFPKIRALFSNFRKRAVETSLPSPLQLRACKTWF